MPSHNATADGWLRGLCHAQGWYFVLTGIWPTVSPQSFQWVTGPKSDVWLVKTVGALIAVAGVSLLSAAFRRNISTETWLVGIGSAFALGTVDVVYVTLRTIPQIYLLDAALEAVLVALWIILGKSVWHA